MRNITKAPASVKMTLCVDSADFWSSLERDILSARNTVYIQTLSFEGDTAGIALSRSLLASPARDRRILIDSFTRYVVSDQFLYTPWALLNHDLRKEVRATRRISDEMRQAGVTLQFMRPLGSRLSRLPFRNHKKLALIDDRVAYIGGINFSEHNFLWHDIMLRIEGEEVTRYLRDDFLLTWKGVDRNSSRDFHDLEIHLSDGDDNSTLLGAVAREIDHARQEIYLQCPYIMEPFFTLLARARRRGVRVALVIPEQINRRLMKSAVIEGCRRHGFELHLYRNRMTHVKAMLIDDSALILGSANFDATSYYLQPEVVGILRQPEIIQTFKEKLIAPDFLNTYPCDLEKRSAFKRHLGRTFMNFMTSTMARISGAKVPLATAPGPESAKTTPSILDTPSRSSARS